MTKDVDVLEITQQSYRFLHFLFGLPLIFLAGLTTIYGIIEAVGPNVRLSDRI